MRHRIPTILVFTFLAWVWGPSPFFVDPASWHHVDVDVAGASVSWDQSAHAQEPRSRFYKFENLFIDGELRKPTALYTNARKQVAFEQLLTLKRSFIADLLETSQDRVFR